MASLLFNRPTALAGTPPLTRIGVFRYVVRYARKRAACRNTPPVSGSSLQVLARVAGRLDGPAGLGALAAGDERPDVDDPLALLAGDARPVVRVGGVGQILVLAELVDAGVQQVLQPQALAARGEELLDRHLLAAVDDVLDHRAR